MIDRIPAAAPHDPRLPRPGDPTRRVRDTLDPPDRSPRRHARRALTVATLVVLGGGASPAAASAIDRWVDGAGGSDAGSNPCILEACKTIAYTIGQSSPGDRIIVQAGTYFEKLTLGPGRTLMASPDGPRPTIDGGLGTAVTVTGGEAQVRGLRLRGDAHGALATGAANETVIADNLFDDPATNNLGRLRIVAGTAAVTGNDFKTPPAGDTTRGVLAGSGTTVVIRGNSFNGYFEAINLTGSPTAPGEISGNTISASRGTSSTTGAAVTATGRVTVADNVIGGSPVAQGDAVGILLYDAGTATNVVTRRNRVSGFPSEGIAGSLSVKGSTFASDGDLLTGSGYGLRIAGGDPQVTGSTIYDNGVRDVSLLGAGTTLTLDSSLIGAKGIVAEPGATCGIGNSRGPTTSGGPCERFQTDVGPGLVPGTFRPASGSPLIDAGNPSAPPAGATDLVGRPRAIVGTPTGGCLPARRDIGAYEYEPATPIGCAPVVPPTMPETPNAVPQAPSGPPTAPPTVAPSGITVLDDAGRSVAVSVDGVKGGAVAAGAVGAVRTAAVGSHTVRVTGQRGVRAATKRITLRAGQLGVIVVTASGGKLRLRVVPIASGTRRVVSLLRGPQRVRIAPAKGKGKRATLRHGAFTALAPSAASMTVSGRRLTLPAATQLTVLVRQRGKLVLVARRARLG